MPVDSHSHTVSVTHCHSLSVTHCHSVTVIHCHSLSLSHCHSFTLSVTHCHSLTVTHCHSLTVTHCHFLTVTLSLSLSLSLSLTLTLSIDNYWSGRKSKPRLDQLLIATASSHIIAFEILLDAASSLHATILYFRPPSKTVKLQRSKIFFVDFDDAPKARFWRDCHVTPKRHICDVLAVI